MHLADANKFRFPLYFLYFPTNFIRVWIYITQRKWNSKTLWQNIYKKSRFNLDSFFSWTIFLFSSLVPIPQYLLWQYIRLFKLLNCLFFQIYLTYRYQGGSMYKVGWFLPNIVSYNSEKIVVCLFKKHWLYLLSVASNARINVFWKKFFWSNPTKLHFPPLF